MTDTTNHAEVIRNALFFKGLIEDYQHARGRALAALDALTRELAEAKKDSDTLNALGHALGRCYCTDQGCYTVEPEILMERARELSAMERDGWDREILLSERVKLLEELMEEALRNFHGKSVLFSYRFIAALAPKEAQG